MAQDPSSGFAASAGLDNDSGLPIFDVQRVQLQFAIAARFVAAQVANNVLVLALSNGRILRIDLERPEDIDDIDLPKRPSEVGVITRMFLDPTASHLLVCTAMGETYYLHAQSRQPRSLPRLRGVAVQSVAWNPALPTASTREILVGAADGHLYETYVEPATEFYRKEEKYVKTLLRVPDGAVTGLWVEALGGSNRQEGIRRVLVSTPTRLLHWVGRVGRAQDNGGGGGTGSVYARLLDGEQPVVHDLSPVPSSSSSSSAAASAAALASSSSAEAPPPTCSSALVVSPDPEESSRDAAAAAAAAAGPPDRAFAWLSPQGVFHGTLLQAPARPELGSKVFGEAKLLTRAQLAAGPRATATASAAGGPQSSLTTTTATTRPRSSAADPPIEGIALTQWHVVGLLGGRVVAANRLTGQVVFDQAIVEDEDDGVGVGIGTGAGAGAGADHHRRPQVIGLCVDQQKATFWLFTADEIYEVVVRDEARDVWRVMLQLQQFDAAMQYARTAAQRDAVATASGDYLLRQGLYDEAAGILGKSSSKPFEEVALALMDRQQADALRKYLLTKLATYRKPGVMQRTMLASWLVELFMAKLNALDDVVGVGEAAGVEGEEGEGVDKDDQTEKKNTAQAREQLVAVREEFQAFVHKHKADLDRKTVYDLISSHGREQELLFFADAVGDCHYVLSYWVQREQWAAALAVLQRQTDPDVFYRYSSVLMAHAATELVDVLMRQGAALQARHLIPALLAYDEQVQVQQAGAGGKDVPVPVPVPLAQNQAVRYLQYAVDVLGATDAAVHNTLVALYAAHAPQRRDETALLAYLEAQGDEPRYDPDFALRLCIQHRRVLSCVHIYTRMGQYAQAVDLALAHDAVELAAVVADRPSGPGPGPAALRKRLWLAVARKVIAQQGSGGIKTAIAFLKRCELLKIEDLIPFFPDFVVIDDFKDDICAALEDYSHAIDALRREMDDSAQTAAHIRRAVAALDHRFAIVEPGEACSACALPLLSRQFFVFPCQHAFHSDCLGRAVLETAGAAQGRRIRDLQVQLTRGLAGSSSSSSSAALKEQLVAELDALVAAACILCSDVAIKKIDEPFVRADEDTRAWEV